jgi:hypothetical protein
MSAFKEGTVIDVNQTTNEVTIQLDKPLQTAFDQPSKFYAPLDDLSEQDLITVNLILLLFGSIDKYLFQVILPFSDLNSVRLLSTSNENTAT